MYDPVYAIKDCSHTKKSAIRRWSCWFFLIKCDGVGLVDDGVLKQAASRLMTTRLFVCFCGKKCGAA